jgi:lipopolysaccharide/colanic/teichoic acid biosynthesis glycosyltransferase
LELNYVDNISLLTDIKIIIKTLRVVLQGVGGE